MSKTRSRPERKAISFTEGGVMMKQGMKIVVLILLGSSLPVVHQQRAGGEGH